MPADPATAKNMFFDTDYPLDKVVLYKEGSFDSLFPGVATISHGLPFKPLPYAQWSLTPDFAAPQEVAMGYSDMYDPVNFPYNSFVEANSTNLIMTVAYFGSVPASVTIYYRIYCFEPTNSGDPDIASSILIGNKDNFSRNTDRRYLKLFDANRIVVGAAPFVVPHNLGYVPTVLAWEEDSAISANSVHPPFATVIYQHPTVLTPSIYGSVVVDATNITFIKNNTYHYRIYLDD